MVRTTRDHPENSPEGQQSKADAAKADPSTKQVQETVDEETERGYRGVEVDPTPNENYTIAGVTKGAPTPETDDKAAEEARKAQADASTKAAGVAQK